MTNDGVIVSSLTWIARLVEPEAMDDARRLTDALGMTVLVDEPTKLMVRAPGGDVLEYCTGQEAASSALFDGQDTVVGFLVSDLDLAVAALAGAGFLALGEAHRNGAVHFQHFSGPAGVAYGLIEQSE